MLIICVHDVVKSRVSTPWEVTEYQIESVVGHYLERSYALVSLDELSGADERSLAITVDDGRAGAVSWLLRRAKALKVTATVFVVPGWIDNPASVPPHEDYAARAAWEEVEALRDAGHIVGSHGLTHVPLPMLEEDGIRFELQRSKSRIGEMVGAEVRHFAAPYGKLSPAVVEAAKALGYVTIASTVPGVNGESELRAGILKRFLVRSDLPNLGLPTIEGIPPWAFQNGQT